MNERVTIETGSGAVRPDYIPVDAYISRDYVELEKAKLWPKVWQVACREEEIPNPGDFYTYDIADESIAVVRKQDGGIAAYYNVCPHRGRRLTAGCGRMGKFHCKYHGWQWNLDGKPVEIVDRHDWGDRLEDRDVTLQSVKVAIWSGWIFINMDPDSESLEAFLGEAKAMLDPFEIGHMRYVWRKRITMPCNWKTAQEAFVEAYHVQTTHRQLLPYQNDRTYSQAFGKHAMFGYPAETIYGLSSPRIGGPEGDVRQGFYEMQQLLWDTLRANTTEEMLAAAKRLKVELPADIDPFEMLGHFAEFHREEAERTGRPVPDVAPDARAAAGADWTIFPNLVFLHQPTNLLSYRARPNGDDPDSCIFEVNVLERFAPGMEPRDVVVDVADDWQAVDWGEILAQDFQNMEAVQKGMKSRAFKAARPNPVQEVAISNFHKVLLDYLHARF